MGDVLMRGKLLSVVERDGVHEVADRLEATHGCLLRCAGGRTRQLGDFGQLGFALDQREQAAFVSGADDGVALPVSQTGFARDNGRTLGNVDSIGDQAASGVLAGTPVITFSSSPKTAPQVAAIAFVIPDHLVDAFMAQLDALFAQPAADLLRRPAHLAQLRLDLTARRYRDLAGLTSYRLPCLSRPAYRVGGDGTIKVEAACPFCFVFDADLITKAT